MSQKKRVWIIGPIAWDTVIYLEHLPESGGFQQSNLVIERPGGTAANAAIALASSGIETGFAGYIGDDARSEELQKVLDGSQITHQKIVKLKGAPSHVLIFVDNTGERTVLGFSEDRLDSVSITDVPLTKDDVVVFVLWREHFRESLEYAKAQGCITVLGAEALADNSLTADFVIGSGNQVITAEMKKRFNNIILTNGGEGVRSITKESEFFMPAIPSEVIDATGAGDSFLAGFLKGLLDNEFNLEKALEIGVHWGAMAVGRKESTPPSWSDLILKYPYLQSAEG